MSEVQDKFWEAMQSWLPIMREGIDSDLAGIRFESKIEELMAYSMRGYASFLSGSASLPVQFSKTTSLLFSYVRDLPVRDRLMIYPQVRVGLYRVDFLIAVPLDYGRKAAGGKDFIAIECDGHDFHERTKQQAQRDKERDRTLSSYGIEVRRYTGSEIWRDPMGCGADAIEAARRIWIDDLHEAHIAGGAS